MKSGWVRNPTGRGYVFQASSELRKVKARLDRSFNFKELFFSTRVRGSRAYGVEI
jgi:hypothetical protein